MILFYQSIKVHDTDFIVISIICNELIIRCMFRYLNSTNKFIKFMLHVISGKVVDTRDVLN